MILILNLNSGTIYHKFVFFPVIKLVSVFGYVILYDIEGHKATTNTIKTSTK